MQTKVFESVIMLTETLETSLLLACVLIKYFYILIKIFHLLNVCVKSIQLVKVLYFKLHLIQPTVGQYFILIFTICLKSANKYKSEQLLK